MLAVVGASASRLHANSVAYCVARAWGAAGRPTVLVDADTSGSALFERLGEAASRRYDPQRRGLPSLMAARSGVFAEALAAHSYEAAGGGGSVWMLFGPRHVEGGALAARWLAERFGDLRRIDGERSVVLAASLLLGGGPLRALLSQVPAAAVIAPVGSAGELSGLRGELRDAGLGPGGGRRRLGVVVEGDSPVGDAEIADALGARVAGRLEPVADARVLRSPQRRGRLGRDLRALAASLEPLLVPLPAAGGGARAAASSVGGAGEASAAGGFGDSAGRSVGPDGASGGAPRSRRRLGLGRGAALSAGALGASGAGSAR